MHAVIHGAGELTRLDFARLTKLRRQQLPPVLENLLTSAELIR